MKNNTLIALIIGVVIFVMFIFLMKNLTSSPPTSSPKSLYNRLGGVFAISAVVNHFSDALINNPVVGKSSKNPYLKDWNNNKAATRLPGLKFMRTLWLCAVSGGPFVYSPTRAGKCPFSLENAHSNLHISSEEFDAVAKELNNSLLAFNVPNQERSEVLAAFAAHKGDIVGGMVSC